jgi:hypothetical protein
MDFRPGLNDDAQDSRLDRLPLRTDENSVNAVDVVESCREWRADDHAAAMEPVSDVKRDDGAHDEETVLVDGVGDGGRRGDVCVLVRKDGGRGCIVGSGAGGSGALRRAPVRNSRTAMSATSWKAGSIHGDSHRWPGGRASKDLISSTSSSFQAMSRMWSLSRIQETGRCDVGSVAAAAARSSSVYSRRRWVSRCSMCATMQVMQV